MIRLIQNFLIRVRNLIVAEFPLVVGVVIAAIGAASATPVLIPAAIVTALLHFVVSPAFEDAATKAKVIPPTLEEKIAKAVAAQLALIDAGKVKADVPDAPAELAVLDVDKATPAPEADAAFIPAT